MTLKEINPFVRAIKEFTNPKDTCEIAYGLNPRLHYTLSGKASIKLAQTTYPLYKDTAVLIPPGLLYELYVEEPLTSLTLNFDYTQHFTHLEQALHLWREGRDREYIAPLEEISFTDVPALNQEVYMPNAISIRNDMYSILREKEKHESDWRVYSSGVLKTMICKILRTTTNTSSSIDPKAGQILAFIHDNYASGIDNTQIAAHLGYHPYYVNKIFSANVGMTIHEYVNHYRLMMAAYYLSTTTTPVNQICYMVGFQNPSHFTGNFKKKFGVSPKDYRNMRETPLTTPPPKKLGEVLRRYKRIINGGNIYETQIFRNCCSRRLSGSILRLRAL